MIYFFNAILPFCVLASPLFVYAQATDVSLPADTLSEHYKTIPKDFLLTLEQARAELRKREIDEAVKKIVYKPLICRDFVNDLLKKNKMGQIGTSPSGVKRANYTDGKLPLVDVSMAPSGESSGGLRLTSKANENNFNVEISGPSISKSGEQIGNFSESYSFVSDGDQCSLKAITYSFHPQGKAFSDITKLDFAKCVGIQEYLEEHHGSAYRYKIKYNQNERIMEPTEEQAMADQFGYECENLLPAFQDLSPKGQKRVLSSPVIH